jgi:hypothetical protein
LILAQESLPAHRLSFLFIFPSAHPIWHPAHLSLFGPPWPNPSSPSPGHPAATAASWSRCAKHRRRPPSSHDESVSSPDPDPLVPLPFCAVSRCEIVETETSKCTTKLPATASLPFAPLPPRPYKRCPTPVIHHRNSPRHFFLFPAP